MRAFRARRSQRCPQHLGEGDRNCALKFSGRLRNLDIIPEGPEDRLREPPFSGFPVLECPQRLQGNRSHSLRWLAERAGQRGGNNLLDNHVGAAYKL